MDRLCITDSLHPRSKQLIESGGVACRSPSFKAMLNMDTKAASLCQTQVRGPKQLAPQNTVTSIQGLYLMAITIDRRLKLRRKKG